MKKYLPKYTTQAQEMTFGKYQARNGYDVPEWMNADEEGYLVEVTSPSGVTTVWNEKKYFEAFYQEATPAALDFIKLVNECQKEIDSKDKNNENVD